MEIRFGEIFRIHSFYILIVHNYKCKFYAKVIIFCFYQKNGIFYKNGLYLEKRL